MVPYETDDSARIMRRKTLAPSQGVRLEPHLGRPPSGRHVNVGRLARFVQCLADDQAWFQHLAARPEVQSVGG